MDAKSCALLQLIAKIKKRCCEMLGVVACVAQLPRAPVDPYRSSLPSFLTPALPFRRPTITDLGKFIV